MSEFNNGDVTDVLDSFFIDYAIDEDDDEANVRELMQQRSDMSEAVNEWYVKAKAFDRIKAYSDKVINGDMQSLELAEGIMDVVEQYEIQRLLESSERNES